MFSARKDHPWPNQNKAVIGKTSAPSINIGISDKDRAAIAQGLSRLLADTYTLYLTTHNFHWNVTGPMFNTLHTMFMAQYTELWNAVDPIAERIRSLGHVAPGSYAEFGKLATVPDAPPNRPRHWTWCACWSKAMKPWPAPPAACSPGRQGQRRAHGRLAHPAPDGARANRLDAALVARRVTTGFLRAPFFLWVAGRRRIAPCPTRRRPSPAHDAGLAMRAALASHGRPTP